MRPAPGPIPTKLPNIGDAAKLIQKMVDRPDTRLLDSSIGELWELFSDGTPAWITGSNVWMPAVFGTTLSPASDYDVIFSSPEAADRFALGVIAQLNKRLPKEAGRYTMGKSGFGAHRILHPSGVGVIDVWSLDDHESVGEALMGYPHPYQRAAYLLSRSPSTGCLHRITREVPKLSRIADAKIKEHPIYGKKSENDRTKKMLDGLRTTGTFSHLR